MGEVMTLEDMVRMQGLGNRSVMNAPMGQQMFPDSLARAQPAFNPDKFAQMAGLLGQSGLFGNAGPYSGMFNMYKLGRGFGDLIG